MVFTLTIRSSKELKVRINYIKESLTISVALIKLPFLLNPANDDIICRLSCFYNLEKTAAQVSGKCDNQRRGIKFRDNSCAGGLRY